MGIVGAGTARQRALWVPPGASEGGLAQPTSLYWGIWIQAVADNDWTTADAYFAQFPKTPPFMMFGTGGGGGSLTFSGTFESRCNNIRTRGAIPSVNIFPNSLPSRNNNTWINGDHDTWIDTFFGALGTWGNPIQIIWGEECNCNWYETWDDHSENGTGTFALAFQHVYDRVKNVLGITNVEFVWNANIDYPGGPCGTLAQYFPGEAYCDWVSLDAFSSGESSVTFEQLLTGWGSIPNNYADLRALAPNKPIMCWSWGDLASTNQQAKVKSCYDAGLGLGTDGTDKWRAAMPHLCAAIKWDVGSITQATIDDMASYINDSIWIDGHYSSLSSPIPYPPA